jgi:hypothetical protein
VLPASAGSLSITNLPAGATNQEIGSYVITNPTQQNIGVNSITINSGANGSLFQNMNVNIGNNQFGTTQAVVGNNFYYTFSTGSVVPILTPGSTMIVNVYADVIGSDQVGSSDATSLVTCAATVWEGTGAYTCSPATGQTVSITTATSSQ